MCHLETKLTANAENVACVRLDRVRHVENLTISLCLHLSLEGGLDHTKKLVSAG